MSLPTLLLLGACILTIVFLVGAAVYSQYQHHIDDLLYRSQELDDE